MEMLEKGDLVTWESHIGVVVGDVDQDGLDERVTVHWLDDGDITREWKDASRTPRMSIIAKGSETICK
jgi:hypothetical protein